MGMNFWAGMDGQVFVRGHLVMESGEAHGDFYADNFYFNDGNSVRTLISKTAKGNTVDFSDLDYIDLGGMILDGRPGSAGIRFKPGYEPVKYQFSTSVSGPWHDTMETNDKYRRDSFDGGTTWGSAYQFKGTNGSNGTVDYSRVNKILKETYGITTTYITEGAIGSPVIQGAEIYGAQMYANEFNVYPLDESEYTGSFNIYGNFNNEQYHFLKIAYGNSGAYTPEIVFMSPNGASAKWSFGTTYFTGTAVDFSGVSGINWGKNRPYAVLA